MQLTFLPSSITTQIHFGHGILQAKQWLDILVGLKKQLVVICDSRLKTVLVDSWVAFLKAQGIAVIQLSFAAGEESKTRETKAELENLLLAQGCGKESVLIAVGGGVTTDLVGYLASTFCRSVPFLSIPTTLLGMVDAAIGGKTGVNTPFGKNLVGTFYPARHIVIDTATLTSLPEREWKNGLAEIIKYGLIRSPTLFSRLQQNISSWEKKDPDFLKELICESIGIKKHVVETDFQETGYRRILNFGHTVAHAIEFLENYQIAHGEAVAIGMLFEARLSFELGYLSLNLWEQIENLLQRYQFPLALSENISWQGLLGAMRRDKKALKAKPRFVLLDGIGSPVAFDGSYCTSVDEALLQKTLSYLRGRSCLYFA